MAIYYNMGIDCGDSEPIARELVDVFSGFVIELDGVPPANCRASAEQQRGLWFVEVYPSGMGYGTLPESERRPELIDEPHRSVIQEALHERLRSRSGFRRAMFGAECFDLFAYATEDEDSDLDFVGMIFSGTRFPELPTGCEAEPFSPGYLIVTKVDR